MADVYIDTRTEPMFDYEAYPTTRYGRSSLDMAQIQALRLRDEISYTLGDDAVDDFDSRVQNLDEDNAIEDVSEYWTQRYGRTWAEAVTSVVIGLIVTSDLQR